MSQYFAALHAAFRKPKLLVRSLRELFRDRKHLATNLGHLYRSWRNFGVHGLKGALLSIAQGEPPAPDAWVQYQEQIVSTLRRQLKARLASLGTTVKISVLLPTYNTAPDMLDQALQSVQRQIYPHWELCVCDDASTQPHVREMLEARAAADPRIKLHISETNHGVAHASNRALDMATGDFVILLDHDDLLVEQALFRVAESVAHDDPDMLYSDEVVVSADGKVVLNYALRPVFSPEFLRGHPYIVHMVGFRTSLLRDLGGFDESLSISQDYDLILRVTEKARTIVHLPEVLYHWRLHGASAGHQRLSEVMAASTRILQRHLDRTGARGSAGSGAGFNFFSMRYPVPPSARVAVIIPTKNHGELVRQCIDSLRKTISSVAYDIVVIDHASDDPETVAYLQSLRPDVTVLRYEGPFNFSAINNWAVRQLDGTHTHFLFCNNDIEAIHPGWLDRMLELAEQRCVGIVGAQLLYPDRRTIQHAGVCVGAFGIAEHYGKFLQLPPDYIDLAHMGRLVLPHEMSAVTAACLLMRRECFDEIRGFDESLAVGFGDVDLCLRAGQRGWRILYCPTATLLHHESFTRGKSIGYDPHPEDSAKFSARWKEWLEAGDPYFNPGYSLVHTNWHVKNPIDLRVDLSRRIYTYDAATGRQTLHHRCAAQLQHA